MNIIYGIISTISLILMIGTVGASDLDYITIPQLIIKIYVLAMIFSIFITLADKDDVEKY